MRGYKAERFWILNNTVSSKYSLTDTCYNPFICFTYHKGYLTWCWWNIKVYEILLYILDFYNIWHTRLDWGQWEVCVWELCWKYLARRVCVSVCLSVSMYVCTLTSIMHFLLRSFSAPPDNSKIYILYRFCLLLFLRQISVVQDAGYINSSRLWKILIVKHLSLSEFFFLFLYFLLQEGK